MHSLYPHCFRLRESEFTYFYYAGWIFFYPFVHQQNDFVQYKYLPASKRKKGILLDFYQSFPTVKYILDVFQSFKQYIKSWTVRWISFMSTISHVLDVATSPALAKQVKSTKNKATLWTSLRFWKFESQFHLLTDAQMIRIMTAPWLFHNKDGFSFAKSRASRKCREENNWTLNVRIFKECIFPQLWRSFFTWQSQFRYGSFPSVKYLTSEKFLTF